MAPIDATPDGSPTDDASFEAGIREHRELMKQMSTRESWDAESRWVVQARRLAGGALLATALLALVLILWLASSLFLSS